MGEIPSTQTQKTYDSTAEAIKVVLTAADGTTYDGK